MAIYSSEDEVEMRCSQCGELICRMKYAGCTTSICITCQADDGYKKPHEDPIQGPRRSFGLTKRSERKQVPQAPEVTDSLFEKETAPERTIENTWRKKK